MKTKQKKIKKTLHIKADVSKSICAGSMFFCEYYNRGYCKNDGDCISKKRTVL